MSLGLPPSHFYTPHRDVDTGKRVAQRDASLSSTLCIEKDDILPYGVVWLDKHAKERVIDGHAYVQTMSYVNLDVSLAQLLQAVADGYLVAGLHCFLFAGEKSRFRVRWQKSWIRKDLLQ